jgi:hypothetical protein
VKGTPSIIDFNSRKALLSQEEECIVVDFALETASCGFPLSYCHLCEHAEKILCACLGSSFTGAGHYWAECFVERHHDQLKMCWSCTPDSKQGQAVNPATNKAWFSLLEEVLAKGNFDAGCIWATDETVFQLGEGQSERVIGAAGAYQQYQQHSGGRETITAIVSICADSTSIPPAVIFKGSAYLPSWKQDNPLEAL